MEAVHIRLQINRDNTFLLLLQSLFQHNKYCVRNTKLITPKIIVS